MKTLRTIALLLCTIAFFTGWVFLMGMLEDAVKGHWYALPMALSLFIGGFMLSLAMPTKKDIE